MFKTIEDLGDEFLNLWIFIYEDTRWCLNFRRLQILIIFMIFLDIRLIDIIKEKQEIILLIIKIFRNDQLYFIKLLLYKLIPIYGLYYILKAWDIKYCGSESLLIR